MSDCTPTLIPYVGLSYDHSDPVLADSWLGYFRPEFLSGGQAAPKYYAQVPGAVEQLRWFLLGRRGD